MNNLSVSPGSTTRRRLHALLCASAAALGLHGATASAALLLYDGFNYPTGPLLNNTNPSTGNKWLQADTAAPTQVNVVSGSLTVPIPAQPTVGNALAITGGTAGITDRVGLASSRSSGNVYYSMALR